jgi:ABC-2 type transport system ATP-binding protein
MDDVAIKVDHVSKTFKLPHEKQTSIKGALISKLKNGRRTYERQRVLNDISFEIKKGEFFGIVGRNGSGKSTLLKLLAGIYVPSNGHIQVNGKLTPFIELGVGFNPELTGRENVYLNGSLLGFNRKEMQNMYSKIVSFAELEKFMDQKLKNYSSGMQVRLAFSIAIRASSDILVLDEVLAVGDAAFQKKCYEYFMMLKKNKRTVVLVTHDMGAVRQYCDTAIMIEKGEIVRQGAPEKIAQAYQRLFVDKSSHDKTTNLTTDVQDEMRWGSGNLVAETCHVKADNQTITIETTYVAHTPLEAPVLGFSIYDSAGTNVIEGNTLRQRHKTHALSKGDKVTIEWAVPNVLKEGKYSVSVACCNASATDFYDWHNDSGSFTVDRDSPTAALIAPNLVINSYSVKGK